MKLFSCLCYASLVVLLVTASGCGESKTTVSVGVHGVNYGEADYTYVLQDPMDEKNTAGGEVVSAFGAGGTMCCYELPRKWDPRQKIRIITYTDSGTVETGIDKSPPETTLVSLPAYPEGKPAELWVIRAANGQISLVASDVSPNNANWPGSIKGWPVPSVEFQRQYFDKKIQHAQGKVELYEYFLRGLETEPREYARCAWERHAKHNPGALKSFSGPDDVNFRKFAKDAYEADLSDAKENVEELKKDRP